MLQVSRDKNLKIPKQIEVVQENMNSVEDVVATKQGIATGNNVKFNKKQALEKTLENDRELEQVMKIPENANDLIVVTTVKKLCAYIITVTEKSPAKFRGVFVNRMQNYCLETLECLLNANFVRMDSKENKIKRESYQKDAIIKLKMLSYISMVAHNSGCILLKQYKQISIQCGEAINLVSAWKKSDDSRWQKRDNGF